MKKIFKKDLTDSFWKIQHKKIWGLCFDIEKEILKIIGNNTPLTDFIYKNGYKLSNIIFNNALLNVTEN